MNDWPHLLVYLRDKLDYSIKIVGESLGFRLFEIDLSSWRLRLSHNTKIIWIPSSDLKAANPRHIYESIQDVIREQGLSSQTVLILLDGKKRLIRRFIASPFENMVVLGDDDTENIIHSNRPSAILQDIIFEQIPISLLAPYETTTPVIGSRFFGRDSEITRLISNPDTNHLILGIRRIGKTSLLREVERLLNQKKDGPHVIYMDCSDLTTTNDFVREVVRKLEPRELPRIDLQKYIFYFPNFLERMRVKYHKKLVLILDEIDRLIISQRGDWEVFRLLRIASNNGDCRYIVAGFGEGQKAAHELDSPFYNFAQLVYLNEFTHQQAKELIVRPMENLRIHILNPDEIVSRIYEETAGYPNLMQYYCTVLIRRLEQTGEREINTTSLINVYRDEAFKNHLLTSFFQNTHNREKAVAYAVINNSDLNWQRGFNQSQIDASLRRQNLPMPIVEIDAACGVLKMAGFLRQKGRDYFFSSSVFVKVLLDSYDPDFLLRKVKEEGL